MASEAFFRIGGIIVIKSFFARGTTCGRFVQAL